MSTAQKWPEDCASYDPGYEPELDEEEITAQHEGIANTICDALEFKRGLINENLATIRELEREIKQIESAVNAGRWYDLENILSEEEVDILAESDPVDTEDLLDRGAWL